MIAALRRRFTIVCLLLTGLVVGVMALVTLAMAEKQARDNRLAAFQTTVQTIANNLQLGNGIRDIWLSQLEVGGQYVIQIADRDRPLFFAGAWQPQTDRETLLTRAQSLAAEQHGVNIAARPSSSTRTADASFLLHGDAGDSYQAYVAALPTSRGWFGLTVLRDLSPQSAELWRLRATYAAITLGAMLALGVVSWHLSGRVTEPVRRSIEQQVAFVAACSHELRGPLATIRASLAALDVSPADAEQLLGSVTNEVGRLTRLVDDLLMLANSDAATWSMRVTAVDLDTLLIELVEQMRPVASANNHALRLSVPDEVMPIIWADRDRLVQIISILLNNANDYSTPGLPIELSAEVGRGSAMIAVIDHGPGIPATAKGRVFDRFYRVDHGRSDKHHFGLGLSIARELARLHSGSLTLSDTPGGGSTFTLKLPLTSGSRNPADGQPGSNA